MLELKIERDDDGCMLTSYWKSRHVDCTPDEAEYIGRRLGLIKAVSGHLQLEGVLGTLVDQINAVLMTDGEMIAIARSQLDDAGVDTTDLSDLDVAIMDVYAREKLSEAARSIDDPFNADNSGPWSERCYFKIRAPKLDRLFDRFAAEDVNSRK